MREPLIEIPADGLVVGTSAPLPATGGAAPAVPATGTSWVDPDPPPIPQRILRQVEPETRTRWGRFKQEFARRYRRRYRKHHAVYAVALVTLAVLGWLLWPSQTFTDADAARWRRLCTAYATWFGPFVDRLRPEDRLAIREVGLDSVLIEVDNARKAYDPLLIAGIPPSTVGDGQRRAFLLRLAEEPTRLARRPEGVTAAFGAMAGLDRVVNTFHRWPTAVELGQYLPVIESHGWEGPAQEVRQALAQLPPKVADPVDPSLGRIVDAHTLAGQVVTAAQRLGEQTAALAGTDDPVLRAFRQAVEALDGHADFKGDATTPRDQLENLVARLKPLEAFGQRLATVVRDGTWARVDQPHYAQAGRAYAMLQTQKGRVSDDVLRLWLEEMPQFFRVEDDWREAWATQQRARLRDVEDRLARLRAAEHPSAKPMGLRWHKLDERIALLLEPPLVSGSAAALGIHRQEIEAELRDLDAAVDQVLQQVNAARAGP